MHLLARVRSITAHSVLLNALHVFNDGYLASFMLLLPFIASTQQIGLDKVGILGTALNVASLVIALPTAAIARALGGLRALTLAALLYGLALLGIGFFENYIWLLIMFVIGGVCFGLFHPIAFALIAKWTAKAKRSRTIANFTAVGDIGRIGIAAAVSPLAVHLGFQNTVFLYAGAVLLAGIVTSLYVRKHSRRMNEAAPEEKPTTPMTILQVLKTAASFWRQAQIAWMNL